MFRAVGSVLILTGCFCMGLLCREKLKGRIRTLRLLAYVLELFESEIRYGRAVLPECCLRVAEQTQGCLGEALAEVAQRMQENAGDSFEEVFVQSVGAVLEELPLKGEDRRAFFSFVSPAGFVDGQMQLRALAGSREELERTREKLERESEEKGRIAVGMGAMSGILLILILW